MLEKEFLIIEYLDKKKTMKQIAIENNVAVGTVYNYIKIYGIASRPRMTEETKKKISIANKGKTSARKGVKLSNETKKKISEGHKGKYRKPSEYGGHIKKHSRGYKMVRCPDHPYATKDGYVMEHILAYEKYHNCIVDRNKYVIHHIDGNKSNNIKENLLIMTKSEHMSLHAKERQNFKKKGVMTY